MENFIHLHVHTQYSLLDGQASVERLVSKAMKDGMPGMAVTDHGNMFAIKEFLICVSKKNGKIKDQIKNVEAKIKELDPEKDQQEIQSLEQEKSDLKSKIFKPIVGCEMYVARRSMDQKEDKELDLGGYHLIVLAKNLTGYHNLVKLVSRAWTEGFYGRPRTDRSELERYHEGLIVCSACIAGEVPYWIIRDEMDKAREAVRWFKDLFGQDYYLELQRHKATAPHANYETYPLQQKANKAILEIAREEGIKVVCTNDVHFVDEENAEAHDRLICLSTGKDLDDPKRMVYSKQEWFKTKAEMNLLFEDVPEALSNTLEILDKVEVYSIDHPPIMPFFPIPESFGTEEEYRKRFTEQQLFDEFTRDEHGQVVMSDEEAQKKIQKLGGYDKIYRIKFEADYLEKLAFEGAQRCYGEITDEIRERIVFELHVMKTMGFPGYFLIVQDFINAAQQQLGVMVGPGRGSAAGSVVAYCLGITKIDPIRYDLLFERFLNPDRISLPDIDTDFDDDGRSDVLRWVTEKYGVEKVAHIITYSTMATKMVIKDVARVQKLPLQESDRLCKLIPDRLPNVKKIDLQTAIDNVPELKAAENSEDPIERDTFKYAKMLEGNVRGTGVHACGTIICRDDITDWVPVSFAVDKDTGERIMVTQYEGSVIEDTGLIKMDFLGLKTLSILREAVENIKQSQGVDLDLDHIPLDDELTYKLYCEGRTIGTFQFESPGMQKYLRELKPSVFEDLIAMNALYRPGPMDYIPDFIDRKHGRKPIVYDIPIMEKYLKDTYGITVYQEQVMLLSRLLASFTRGESDTLRKAMGKKLKDKLDHLKPKFISGGQKNGHDAKVLEKIWADWEKFASYAFNKSHATCYSWVAYQTAYLKAHYPSEYMAAVMSRNIANNSEITKLMAECRAMGIQVLGPDVNESNLKFTANKAGNIRYGLGAVKGMGESAVSGIIAERRKNGPFQSIYEMMQRVSTSACNKKTLECLAQCGALDSFGIARERYFASNQKNESFIETLVRYGGKYQSEKASSMMSLFGDEEMTTMALPEPPLAEPWNNLEKLNKEKDLIGIYLSAHPLDTYAVLLNEVFNTKMTELQDLSQLSGRSELTMGGLVVGVRRGASKRDGNPYGIVKIEDYSGSHEIAFFGQDWASYQGFLQENTFVFINAKVQPKKYKQEELELRVNGVKLLSEVKKTMVERLSVDVPLSLLSEDVMATIGKGFVPKATTELVLNIIDDTHKDKTRLKLTSTKKRLDLTYEMLEELRDMGLECRVN